MHSNRMSILMAIVMTIHMYLQCIAQFFSLTAVSDSLLNQIFEKRMFRSCIIISSGSVLAARLAIGTFIPALFSNEHHVRNIYRRWQKIPTDMALFEKNMIFNDFFFFEIKKVNERIHIYKKNF